MLNMRSTPRLTTRLLVLLACLAPLSSTLAGGWSKAQLVERLRLHANGDVLVYGATATWKNPDRCQNAKAVLLPGEAQYYPEMYATTLVAQTRESKIRFFLKGCAKLGKATYPVIQTVEKY